MPLAKSQVLILSNLHHSREPVLGRSKCQKLEANPLTMAPSTPIKIKPPQQSTSPLSLPSSDGQQTARPNTSSNPWGPMFKDRDAFIDAHMF